MRGKRIVLVGALLMSLVLLLGMASSAAAQEPPSWWEQMWEWCHGGGAGTTFPDQSAPSASPGQQTGGWLSGVFGRRVPAWPGGGGYGGMMGSYGGMMGGRFGGIGSLGSYSNIVGGWGVYY